MTSRRKAGGGQRKTATARRKAASHARNGAPAARARSSGVRASGTKKPSNAGRLGASQAAANAAFPSDFTIAQAADVKKQLARIIAKPAAVTLDLSPIRRIDTAGLQVLTAFIRERRAAGHDVKVAGATEAFTATAQMLGLGAVFA